MSAETSLLVAGLVLTAGAALFFAAAWRRATRREHQVSDELRALAEEPTRPLSEALLVPSGEGLEGVVGALHRAMAERNERLSLQSSTLIAALDSMAEGVWITDQHGTVTRHNRALKELLYAEARIIGQRPLALLRNESLHEAVMAACRNRSMSQLELAIDWPTARVLSIRVTPLAADLPGSVAVFRDVTALRHLEKVRKDFVANVSHELRTPITAIRGYAETLQGPALENPDTARRMVDIIHRQSERLSDLVEDLLELSRLESRDVMLASVPVSLGLASQRAAETVRVKAEQKRIALQLGVSPELFAQGDGRAIEQVLVNLLDNAVKYTPEGGRVELTGARRGNRCVIEVTDTGLGIESKHLPRVFERFYRADKGRSREMGGTGLGLSIVKHLVGAMDGDVKVESVPGRGSTFTVFLPALQAEPDTSAPNG